MFVFIGGVAYDLFLRSQNKPKLKMLIHELGLFRMPKLSDTYFSIVIVTVVTLTLMYYVLE